MIRIGPCLIKLMTFSDSHVDMYISCLGLTKCKLLVFVLKDIYIPTKVAILSRWIQWQVNYNYLLYMMKTLWLEGGNTMKELPIDEHPPLLIIDQSMLIRIICTEKCECRTF